MMPEWRIAHERKILGGFPSYRGDPAQPVKIPPFSLVPPLTEKRLYNVDTSL